MIKIYEIETKDLQQIKNILEAQDIIDKELDVEIEKEQGKGNLEKAKSWKVNEFKKQGYILREAKSLNIDKKASYLYIKAPEDFFKRNEQFLIDAGAKEVKGNDYEKILVTIEEQEAGASEGIGFIFG